MGPNFLERIRQHQIWLENFRARNNAQNALRFEAQHESFSGFRIAGLDLTDVHLYGCALEQMAFLTVPLNGAVLYGSTASGCLFESCILRKTELQDCVIKNCTFRDCHFNRSVFNGARVSDNVFENCRIIDCDMLNVDLASNRFVSCIITRSSVHAAVLPRSALRQIVESYRG